MPAAESIVKEGDASSENLTFSVMEEAEEDSRRYHEVSEPTCVSAFTNQICSHTLDRGFRNKRSCH
eukprot:3357350-Amphidinium_carterae.1